MDDLVEGEGVVDFAVVGYRVDFVVFYEARDGEAVVFVVAGVEGAGVGGGE